MRRVAREIELGDVIWFARQWRKVTHVDSMGAFMSVELDGHVDAQFPVWDQVRVAA